MTIQTRAWLSLMALLIIVAANCGTGGQHSTAAPPLSEGGVAGGMQLTSTAFSPHGPIPRRYTCQGDDVSPPLAWSNVPPRTKSLVLVVDDPDAPDPAAPQMTWVHWVLYNIPPGTSGLPEKVSPLPPGTVEGLNNWKRTGYGGPCPPIGRHRYFHRLYALDTLLAEEPAQTKNALEQAMKGHILDQCELVGTYEKTP